MPLAPSEDARRDPLLDEGAGVAAETPSRIRRRRGGRRERGSRRRERLATTTTRGAGGGGPPARGCLHQHPSSGPLHQPLAESFGKWGRRGPQAPPWRRLRQHPRPAARLGHAEGRPWWRWRQVATFGRCVDARRFEGQPPAPRQLVFLPARRWRSPQRQQQQQKHHQSEQLQLRVFHARQAPAAHQRQED